MIPKTEKEADFVKSKLFSICEIRPYLFIAGYGALTHQKVKELGITHAVDATNISKTQRTPDVEYLEVKIDDNEGSDIKKYFNESASFIRKAKESLMDEKFSLMDENTLFENSGDFGRFAGDGGKALVYCAAGISRSASICMMYLVIEENVTLRDAFIEVGRARRIICPNLGFWRQMIDYEIEKRGATSVNLLNGMRRPIPDVYLYKSSLLQNA
uniref:Protein-serine/threonine phosphatase n=1 Tax=Panagrolaimus davidi TaxID=227884 RepID=A0A914PBD8_9BILA